MTELNKAPVLTDEQIRNIPNTEYLIDGDCEPGGTCGELEYSDYEPLLSTQRDSDDTYCRNYYMKVIEQVKRETAQEIYNKLERNFGWFVGDKLEKLIVDNTGYSGSRDLLNEYNNLKKGDGVE